MGSPYDVFKNWTARRKRTDLWRAGFGIIFIIVLLVLFTGCATQSGPQMTLAASYEGDGFIRLTQPVYDTKNGQWFVEYEHHSEIFQETLEDTGDFGLVGYRHQFGKWKWQK